MNILAIETSAQFCSVALSVNDNLTEQHQLSPMSQAQCVLPIIDELLRAEHIPLKQLDVIAVGVGPGSFTGIRLAVSVAQGLGYALGIRIIPISSLAAAAQAAYQAQGLKNLYVAIDARMQEVYAARYQVNEEDGCVVLIGEECVCSPSHLLKVPADETFWYGIGNAWEVYADQCPFALAGYDTHQWPRASALIPLALASIKKKAWLLPSEALPVYLRDKVAIKRDKG
jgi:tRNA threonylcarbamoyladenosine biosynthesis protein TsaB